MTLTLAPNIEALVGKWLRTDAAIAAFSAYVGGRTPNSIAWPWIRVTLLAARDDALIGREHLVEYALQLECNAGTTAMNAGTGQATAWNLKASARAILAGVQGRGLDGVVVPAVRFTGDAHLPDVTIEPAHERYVLTVAVSAYAVSS